MRRSVLVLLPALALVQAAVRGDWPETSRSFAMGFTPFPHDGALQGVLDAFEMIDEEGDLAVYHWDNGVPWNEMLNGQPHPDLGTLQYLRSLCPAGNEVYLAVTPISITRDGLAPFYGDQPLTPPWDGYAFDDPDVVTSFANYCEAMIAIFQPKWLAFGIEANLLHSFAPAKWNAYVSLATQTSAALRANHPSLPVFVSLQADDFWDRVNDPPDPTTGLTHRQACAQFVALGDLVGVSCYPVWSTWSGKVWQLPADYLDRIARLDPGKPLAIAETGWPAERLDAPYPITQRIHAQDQRDWVDLMLSTLERRNAVFVNWYLTWDFDDLWNSGTLPHTALNRYFRDMGLKDGRGGFRPGLATWREWLARPRR